jgi:hypothetical protein
MHQPATNPFPPVTRTVSVIAKSSGNKSALVDFKVFCPTSGKAIATALVSITKTGATPLAGFHARLLAARSQRTLSINQFVLRPARRDSPPGS